MLEFNSNLYQLAYGKFGFGKIGFGIVVSLKVVSKNLSITLSENFTWVFTKTNMWF